MIPVIERFLSKISVSDSGCWEWTAALTPDGYGLFSLGKILVYSHRFIYEFYYEEIPEGLQIDHLCRNRGCCNPFHLEAVTPKENSSRGLGGRHSNHAKGIYHYRYVGSKRKNKKSHI